MNLRVVSCCLLSMMVCVASKSVLPIDQEVLIFMNSQQKIVPNIIMNFSLQSSESRFGSALRRPLLRHGMGRLMPLGHHGLLGAANPNESDEQIDNHQAGGVDSVVGSTYQGAADLGSTYHGAANLGSTYHGAAEDAVPLYEHEMSVPESYEAYDNYYDQHYPMPYDYYGQQMIEAPVQMHSQQVYGTVSDHSPYYVVTMPSSNPSDHMYMHPDMEPIVGAENPMESVSIRTYIYVYVIDKFHL